MAHAQGVPVIYTTGVRRDDNWDSGSNLCDMQAKYADVVPVAEVKSYPASLPKGLFDLPRGVPRRA